MRPGTEALWELAGSRGRHIRIALLDTGIDLSHSVFKGVNVVVRDICSPAGSGRDVSGHGTQCAGIIAGLAPESTILCGRILDRGGNFTYDALLGGFNWAVSEGADLVCVCTGERYEDPDVTTKVARLAEAGCWTIGAVGNHGRTGKDAGVFPARCGDSLAIGSANDENSLSTFTDIPSDKEIFCVAGEEYEVPDLGGAYRQITGTSASACWMTGVIALYLAGTRRKASATEMLDRVRASSTLLGSARGPYWLVDGIRLVSRAS